MINQRFRYAFLAATTMAAVTINAYPSYAGMPQEAADAARRSEGGKWVQQQVRQMLPKIRDGAATGIGTVGVTGTVYCVSNPRSCEQKKNEAVDYYRGDSPATNTQLPQVTEDNR